MGARPVHQHTPRLQHHLLPAHYPLQIAATPCLAAAGCSLMTTTPEALHSARLGSAH